MDSIQLQLYNNDLAAPTQIIRDISNYSNLRFSTKLHGGFAKCSFSLTEYDMNKIYEWAWKRFGYRLVAYDLVNAKTLWEGRLQSNPFTLNSVQVNAYGYYSSLLDGIYSTAYDDTADVVLKAMLTASCPAINADQSNIQALDTARDSAVGDDYLDRPVQELAEYLFGMSDSVMQKWYLAVWEDQIMYAFPRDDTSVTWSVKAKDLQTFGLTPGFENLWNAAYAVYRDVDDTILRTSVATDTTSIAKYGVQRTYTIPDLGQVAQADAEAIRDTWIADHKDIISSDSNLVLGETVYNTDGTTFPSSHVRAGDVIQVKDILPSTEDLASPRRNGINTFYILETEYDAKNRTNRLVVDTESQSLEAILARQLSK
jgi:hypothetical protein